MQMITNLAGEVQGFKSLPLHFYLFTGEKHSFDKELFTVV